MHKAVQYLVMYCACTPHAGSLQLRHTRLFPLNCRAEAFAAWPRIGPSGICSWPAKETIVRHVGEVPRIQRGKGMLLPIRFSREGLCSMEAHVPLRNYSCTGLKVLLDCIRASTLLGTAPGRTGPGVHCRVQRFVLSQNQEH